MTGSAAKPPLLGLDVTELGELLAGLPGVRSFTAKQVETWLHERKVGSFEEMTNLGKPLRAALAERFRVDPLEVESEETGADGTRKVVFRLDDGGRVEAVDIPATAAAPSGEVTVGRTTFCLSSQAGCAQDCVFCVTGRIGPGRNLSAAEIYGQYVRMLRGRHDPEKERLNVVFMGMGEPTANLPAVRKAFDLLRRDIPARRITLSTVGVVPGIDEIASWEIRPNLAVSVSAGDDELRSELMPINRVHPLADLRRALLRYPLEPGRRITIEYVLIAGVNDSEEQASKLAGFLRGLDAKVNVIPLNEDAKWLPGLKRPGEAVIDRFCDALVRRGADVTVRRSKGATAQAACGQLKGRDEPVRESRAAAAFHRGRRMKIGPQ